jgi:RND family efflux transporter MFP subunit
MSGKNPLQLSRFIPGKRLGIFIAICAVTIGTLWWFNGRKLSTPDTAPGQEESTSINKDGSVTLLKSQLEAQNIETAPVEDATYFPVPGLPAQAIAPLESSTQVTAPYAGVVTRILVDAGASVQQGQPLLVIQSRDVLVAQSALKKAEAEAAMASRQARRDASLLAEGIISAARNEQSQARNKAAQSALTQAAGALASLGNVENSQAGEYAVLSPMTGDVLQRYPEPGQSVSAFETVFTIAKPGLMDIHFSAPLNWLEQIRPGTQVKLPGGYQASVAAVGANADPASQSLRVRAHLKIEGQAKQPFIAGQQFPVTLLLQAPENALAVPAAALLPLGNAQVVFVARPDTTSGSVKIYAVPVRQLGSDNDISIIVNTSERYAGTLTKHALVVTRGTSVLKSMIPVQ